MTTEYSTIPRSYIINSLTNPRKHFAQAALDELAASIQFSGIHQPVLLRPLPAARLADTVGLAPRPTHELVTGERRYRAAGQVSANYGMPCIVRELTNQQVIDIQLTENMQREDLTHLEESDGIQLMLQGVDQGGLGLTVDQAATRLGKSRRTIFSRISLQALFPAARTARYDGTIDDARAFEISRIPTQAGQAKALKEASRTDHTGQPATGVRALRTWINNNIMLVVAQAPFDIASVHLPAADAHKACSSCPTTSHASADLFDADDTPNMCLDAACWQAKDQASVAAVKAKYELKGFEVITGAQAKKLLPFGSHLTYDSAYQNLKATIRGTPAGGDDGDNPQDFSLRRALGKRIADCDPIAIISPHDATIIEAVNAAKAKAVLEDLGLVKVIGIKNKSADSAKHKKINDELQAQATIAAMIKSDLINAAEKLPLDLNLLLAQPYLQMLILNCINESIFDISSQEQEFISKSTPLDGKVQDQFLPTFLMRSLFVYLLKTEEFYLPKYLRAFGIDLAASEKRVREQLRAEEKSLTPTAPLAEQFAKTDFSKAENPKRPPAKPRKPKLSAKDAQLGIAEAMQDTEGAAALAAADNPTPSAFGKAPTKAPAAKVDNGFAVGQAVIVTASADTLHMRAEKYSGKKGTITKRLNSSSWDVTFKGRTGGIASFASSEISAAL